MEDNHEVIKGLINNIIEVRRVKYPKPQPFSGDDHSQQKGEVFLNEVDYYFTANAIPNNFHQRLRNFNGVLDEKDSAKRWVGPLIKHQDSFSKSHPKSTFSQYLQERNHFVAKFSERFGDS